MSSYHPKPIPGYKGLYLIYPDGQVESIGKNHHKRGGFLKHVTVNKHGERGYKRVTLVNRNGKVRPHSIHRLVAEAFIPNSDNKPYVHHKDGNPANNHVSNLEWATPKENYYRAIDAGKIELKLTDIQVGKIRDKHKTRKYGEKIWEKYNITRGYYYKIVQGDRRQNALY